MRLLKNLSDNPKNYVYIITGKPRKFLMKWFKDVKNLGFGAEYGCFWKDAHDPQQQIKTTMTMTNDWLDAAYSIIKQFQSKTEGSRTEVKDSSICWNFGNSDQYSGNIQASDLTIQLSNLFPNSTQLEVVTGKDYVEVKPKNLNKGYFISFVLREFIKKNKGKKPDYIFACGDDVSDEEMFKYLNFVNKQKNIKVEDIKMDLVDLDKEKAMEIASEKAAVLKTKAQDLANLAKDKGTPVLKKTANDVLDKVIKISKDTQKKISNK